MLQYFYTFISGVVINGANRKVFKNILRQEDVTVVELIVTYQEEFDV